MTGVQRHLPVLDYARPRRSVWSLWDGRLLDVTLDAALVLVAGLAVASLVAVARAILLLATAPGRLFGVPW